MTPPQELLWPHVHGAHAVHHEHLPRSGGRATLCCWGGRAGRLGRRQTGGPTDSSTNSAWVKVICKAVRAGRVPVRGCAVTCQREEATETRHHNTNAKKLNVWICSGSFELQKNLPVFGPSPRLSTCPREELSGE